MNIPSPRNRNIAENIWFSGVIWDASDTMLPVIAVPPIANIIANSKNMNVSDKTSFFFILLFVNVFVFLYFVKKF